EVVGHCPVAGRSEEWGVGRRPGSARLGTVPMCLSEASGPLSHIVDQAKGYSEKLRPGCAESRLYYCGEKEGHLLPRRERRSSTSPTRQRVRPRRDRSSTRWRVGLV